MFDFREYGQGIYAFDTGYVRPLLAAVHVLVENGRVAIIDTGTNDTLSNATTFLQKLGVPSDAVDYIILSHIHLDHAGGAGAMMAAFPLAKLVVHPRGARHMAEPSKLIAGVTKVYGAEYVKKMYGEILPIPATRIIEARDGTLLDLAGRPLFFMETPGHARHHICVFDQQSGGVFTGDLFGLAYPNMEVGGRPFIFPTTTPTQFEPAAMRDSIERLLQLKPTAMYLTHYGRVLDPVSLSRDLLRRLEFHVTTALRERDAGGDRHARIKTALRDYLLAEVSAFGCPLSTPELMEWWENDLELNAQGLAAWLDSGALT